MVNLLYTELLKLRRSYMFIISLIGAFVAPFLDYIMYYQYKKEKSVNVSINEFADQTNMFVMILIGTMLYGLIATYLFNREYEEDTLKNLLTIPVNRTKLVFSKMILLFGWIEILSIFAVVLTIIFSFLGGFKGITIENILSIVKDFILGGAISFLLTMPVILITLLFKNYVPSIVFTIFVTIGSVIILNSEKVVFYPWGSAYMLVTSKVSLEELTKAAETSIYTPLIVILLTFIVSLISTISFFRKQDIA